MVGTDPAFLRELGKLPAYAGCEAGVLVLGETGTGKEVFARAVHRMSARAGRPWVAVNCGAMPTELVESELFGHAKGAFTTALCSRAGLVSEAEGGSLFLDDVDCLPPPAQVKLLRFLQEREYRPVGSGQVRRADVRVIAAGNLRLPQMVARGEFRADLFFRLNVLLLQLPALRERREDIAPLAAHFLAGFARQHGRDVRTLSAGALERLFLHPWPGNVRELQHVIERAVLLAAGERLEAGDLELGQAPGGTWEGGRIAGCAESGGDIRSIANHRRASEAPGAIETVESFRAAKGRVVRQFERSYLEHLLSLCQGNVTQAAQQAGKNRRAFFELMRKHGVTAAQFRTPPQVTPSQ